MAKRVLLVGGTGFIGSNLARKLLEEGHDVSLLVRSGYRAWRIADIHKHVRMIEIDLLDRISVAECIENLKPDWIFNLASYGAYPDQVDTSQMIDTNLKGTINLVDACVKTGFESFIYAGSSSEYGFKDHAPDEMEWLEPNSPYAITKAAASHYCCYVAQKTGRNISVLRLYSVFGTYEEPTRLIPRMILKGLEGHFPPLVDPQIARDFVYIDDVCRAFLLVASQPGEETGTIYNVGCGVQVTLQEVVEICRRLLKIQEEPVWGSLPKRVWDTNIWISNPERIKAKVGWIPHYSFEMGLVETINWFRDNPLMLDFYKQYN